MIPLVLFWHATNVNLIHSVLPFRCKTVFYHSKWVGKGYVPVKKADIYVFIMIIKRHLDAILLSEKVP